MDIPNVKECNCCYQIKTLDQFHKSPHCKYKVTNKCKECRKKDYQENIDKNREVARKWRENNLERARKNSLDHYRKNKQKYRENFKEWKKKNPEFDKQNYQKNKEKHKIWSKKWQQNNKKYLKEYNKNYRKNILNNNINYRIAHRIRRRIRNEIKQARGVKLVSTPGLVGCSWDFLMKYIESKFYDKILPNGEILKMSWENYGYGEKCWHLDHFLPCCSFYLSKLEEQRKCFHYSNLRPLWQSENCEKSGQDKKLSIRNQLNKHGVDVF